MKPPSPFAPSPILTVWVIYYGASNHPPGTWVVRAQDVLTDNTIRPHEVFFECDSLDQARGKVPAGLIRYDRRAADDPVIVESWL